MPRCWAAIAQLDGRTSPSWMGRHRPAHAPSLTASSPSWTAVAQLDLRSPGLAVSAVLPATGNLKQRRLVLVCRLIIAQHCPTTSRERPPGRSRAEHRRLAMICTEASWVSQRQRASLSRGCPQGTGTATGTQPGGASPGPPRRPFTRSPMIRRDHGRDPLNLDIKSRQSRQHRRRDGHSQGRP